MAYNDKDIRAGLPGYVQFNKYTHTQVSLIRPWEDQCEWHRMTRMAGPDSAVMCNLINTHTHTHTHTRVAWNDSDDRAGLHGYVQFNKYTHTHTRNKFH